jgi:hypothetical protein
MDVVETENIHSIYGMVTYAQNVLRKVPNAWITRTGSPKDSIYTSSSGEYAFTDIMQSDSIYLTPRKAATDTGITAQDAALVARKAAGLETLSDAALASADADGNGRVDAFDAALIARAAVGLPALSGTRAGTWQFTPARAGFAMNSSYFGANFSAILIGDVDGDWASSGLAKAAFWIPAPDSITADTTGEVIIPVRIEADQQCLSADFRISFDPECLVFVDASVVPYDTPSHLVCNADSGLVRLAFWRETYLEGPCDLFHLRFRVNRFLPATLHWERILMNGRPSALTETVIESSADDGRIPSPSDFTLSANFPNPFNGGTTIRYTLASDGPVNLTLFDDSGRMIAALVQTWQQKGAHEILWNGKDIYGRETPSGVYLCRLQTRSRMAVLKMIKMK